MRRQGVTPLCVVEYEDQPAEGTCSREPLCPLCECVEALSTMSRNVVTPIVRQGGVGNEEAPLSVHLICICTA